LKYDNATKYQNTLETRRSRGSEVRRSEDVLDSKKRRAGLENRPGGVQRH